MGYFLLRYLEKGACITPYTPPLIIEARYGITCPLARYQKFVVAAVVKQTIPAGQDPAGHLSRRVDAYTITMLIIGNTGELGGAQTLNGS